MNDESGEGEAWFEDGFFDLQLLTEMNTLALTEEGGLPDPAWNFFGTLGLARSLAVLNRLAADHAIFPFAESDGSITGDGEILEILKGAEMLCSGTLDSRYVRNKNSALNNPQSNQSTLPKKLLSP